MVPSRHAGLDEARTPSQPVRASSRCATWVRCELRAVPCVPSDMGVHTELIAPYPLSDRAALFVIETDTISLIGPISLTLRLTHLCALRDATQGPAVSRV